MRRSYRRVPILTTARSQRLSDSWAVMCRAVPGRAQSANAPNRTTANAALQSLDSLGRMSEITRIAALRSAWANGISGRFSVRARPV